MNYLDYKFIIHFLNLNNLKVNQKQEYYMKNQNIQSLMNHIKIKTIHIYFINLGYQ